MLLFVAAHWDALSPDSRFLLVLSMIAAFHAGAAATSGHPGLSMALHAAGTGSLGAGVYLAGQIFNIEEHWPGAIMLWSLGAALGLALLRDWPHVLWVAVLVPAWLWGEWMEVQPSDAFSERLAPAAVGLVVLAFAYLMARSDRNDAVWRSALARLGASALIPAAAVLGIRAYEGPGRSDPPEPMALVIAWAVALLLPFATGWLVRGRKAAYLLPALVWAFAVSRIEARSDPGELALYVSCAVGAIGVVAWGLMDRQPLPVNVGILGFALSVAGFYFSTMFDKLGRSLGLIGMGVIFLGGGWLLERTRRRLIDRIEGAST